MVRSLMFFPLALSIALSPQPQPPTTPDADLWTAAVEQLRLSTFGSDLELVIADQNTLTAEFHCLSDSLRETYLLDLLRQRNNSTRKAVSGVRLPPHTRLVAASMVEKWEDSSKTFPGAKVLKFSLPAFSEDGTRALLYYSASGGFGDAQGGYLLFEKKQERWIISAGLCLWIT